MDDTSFQRNIAVTADAQLSSPFFSRFPLEIRRMIYAEVWRHNRLHRDARDQTTARCLKQHIIMHQPESGGSYYGHSPCVVSDQGAVDPRISMQDIAHSQSLENEDAWSERNASGWNVHWPCEELYRKHASHRRPSRSTFMSAMLTCKRMYQECRESIYSTLTFVFTDMDTANSFISLYPPETFQSLELAIGITHVLVRLYPPILGEGYQPTVPRFMQHDLVVDMVDTANNPWADLCRTLTACNNLWKLSMWFSINPPMESDWTTIMWERIFFAPLWQVRVNRARDGDEGFLLLLPELNWLHVQQRALYSKTSDSYLLGSEALEGAPFVLRRGRRSAPLGMNAPRRRLLIEAPPQETSFDGVD